MSAELRRHRLVGELLQPLGDHLRIDRFFLEPLVDRRLEAEDRVDALLQALDVPLLGIGALRAVHRDDRVDASRRACRRSTSLTLSASMMSARCS